MTAAYVTLILDVVTSSGAELAQGSVSIAPSMVLPSPADQILVSQMPYTIYFKGNSYPQVQLVGNDTIGPQQGNGTPGWNYVFTPDAPSGLTAASYYVLYSNGPTQRLSALAASPAAQPGSQTVPLPAAGPTSLTQVLGLADVSPVETEWVPGAAQILNGDGVRPFVVNLEDAPVIAVDASAGNDFRVQLGGNRTIGAPSNPADGQRITISVQQPGSGGPYTPVFSGSAGGFSYGSAFAPSWSTAANAIDITGWLYRADKGVWCYTGAGLGF
ncbi:MAG TPA: hypothetical protein VHE33_15375 [Acidobacteriaceae bacterium]|nr:hypothetical protein [Acidobacteriaceae bacterium]